MTNESQKSANSIESDLKKSSFFQPLAEAKLASNSKDFIKTGDRFIVYHWTSERALPFINPNGTMTQSFVEHCRDNTDLSGFAMYVAKRPSHSAEYACKSDRPVLLEVSVPRGLLKAPPNLEDKNWYSLPLNPQKLDSIFLRPFTGLGLNQEELDQEKAAVMQVIQQTYANKRQRPSEIFLAQIEKIMSPSQQTKMDLLKSLKSHEFKQNTSLKLGRSASN